MFKPLTDEDVVKVSVAKMRESYAHRRWPREAVTAFASAEITTAPRGRRASRSRRLARRLIRIRSRLRLARLRVRGEG